jgi:hypothetical protein
MITLGYLTNFSERLRLEAYFYDHCIHPDQGVTLRSRARQKMPRGPSLTENEKTRISELRSLGWSVLAIARRIERSEGAVRSFVKDPSGENRKKRPGRAPKLSPRDVRHVFHLACSDHIKPAKIIETLQLPCKPRTVRRALLATGNAHYVKRKSMPLMTKTHITNRLIYADRKLRDNFNWDVVVISDEKKFNLDGPDGCQYYWHDRRLPPEMYSKRVAGGGSVMVWAGISAVGKTEIVFLEGRQRASHYIATLTAALQPFLDGIRPRLGGAEPIFQQDGASIHTAKTVKTWFQEQNIATVDWPAKSPDLSPIENVWGDLALRVYDNGQQFDNRDDLKRAILKAWSEITDERLKKLMDGMRGRMVDVVRRKGAHIGK